jgi:ABC-2 type transport system ATP-binding protein
MAGELAMGWKQRLALGCAMVHEPEILFLDEPTGGVDPVSRRNFWDLIYTVAAHGVTVFVTTHYMDEAEHCDRLGLINAGKLIAMGSPREMKARYVAGTLLEVHAEPIMHALDILATVPAAKEVAIFGAALHVVADSPAEIAPIRRALERGGVTVTGIESIMPSLEDVFVALIEQATQERES